MSRLILEWATKEEADKGLEFINQLAIMYHIEIGETVIADPDSPTGKKIVSRRASNGELRPDACGTKTWDSVKESPDGTFYIASPAVKPQYVNWRDRIPPGVVMPDDKEYPDAWNVVEEEI